MHDPAMDIRQLENVGEAFSRQSPSFDAYEEKNEILKWMRRQIHKEALRFLVPDAHVLELNCGTGIDAVFFARRGCKVYATDIADGMLRETQTKVIALQLQDRISVNKCSYTELDKVNGGRFDYVFSDFGGLNCIPDLSIVTEKLPALLNPGAYISFVLMPPVCPWELALGFKGNFSVALRRFRKSGAESHLEGVHFKSWYFSPRQAIKAFGDSFEFTSLMGVASLSPPPYLENFPGRFPGLYPQLCALDEKFSHIWPFNRWADHYMLTMRYKGSGHL